jgi:hypothetical protein
LALIGILGGVLLLAGPLEGLFWQGIALFAVGSLSLVLALGGIVRRRRADDTVIDGPMWVTDDIGDLSGPDPDAIPTDVIEGPSNPDPDVVDRRLRRLEIVLKVMMALGTFAVAYMSIFVFPPGSDQRRQEEEKRQKQLAEIVKAAREGKTGGALQFLITGDRSHLGPAKTKGAGPAVVTGQGPQGRPSPRP